MAADRYDGPGFRPDQDWAPPAQRRGMPPGAEGGSPEAARGRWSAKETEAYVL